MASHNATMVSYSLGFLVQQSVLLRGKWILKTLPLSMGKSSCEFIAEWAIREDEAW